MTFAGDRKQKLVYFDGKNFERARVREGGRRSSIERSVLAERNARSAPRLAASESH